MLKVFKILIIKSLFLELFDLVCEVNGPKNNADEHGLAEYFVEVIWLLKPVVGYIFEPEMKAYYVWEFIGYRMIIARYRWQIV